MESREFAKGAIVRVRFENFLTYDSVEFSPGPQLNLIIGPNGTGKSTIVCGICLGLGGKPNIIGRAAQISDYIKHGTTRATTEIELFNPDGQNWIITRKIHRNNVSDWTLNNRPASQKNVEKLTSQLNIQVGNLCQFLPQDRVSDFAKMSQQELLENTEKAVGPPEMLEDHIRLKEMSGTIRRVECSAKSSLEHLEKEKQKIMRMQEEVKNYKERQRHLEQIAVLKQKRSWVEYEEVRRCYVREKEEKEALQRRLEALKTSNSPLQKKLNDAKAAVKGLEDETRLLEISIKSNAMKVANRTRQIEEYNTKIVECQEELKAKKMDENQRIGRIRDVTRIVEGLENELENISQNMRDVQPLLNDLQSQMQELGRTMSGLQSDMESCRASRLAKEMEIKSVEHRLTRIQDTARLKMNLLHQRHKDAYDATIWLRQNMHLFKEPVYEPIMLQINMKDQSWAKYVEMHIPFKDMVAFVCENKDDLKLFMAEVRDKCSLKINAVLAPPENINSFRSSVPIEHYKKYGFHSYVKDLFSAPEAVMKYLCKLYNIHDIPVGNKYTQEHVESVLNHTKLRRFYTDSHVYSCTHSLYAPGVKSTMSTELKKAVLLTNSIDVAALQELNSKCEFLKRELQQEGAAYDQLKNVERELLSKQHKLREDQKALRAEKDKRKTLMEKINQKKQSIQRMEREAINIEEEEAKFASRVMNINKKKCALLKEVAKHTNECIKETMRKVRICLHHAQGLANTIKLEQECQEALASLHSMQKDLENAKIHIKRKKEEAQRLLAIAKQSTGTGPNEELSEQLHQEFDLLPNTLEEIDGMIHEQQAKVDCLLQTDGNVIQEHKQLCHQVNQLEKDTNDTQQRLEDLQREVSEIKANWLSPLENLIRKINKNFSDFMAMLDCAGEVSLNKSENENEFEKYGICIKVKYRDSEHLKELTPYQQSGGERSVATVLYMMALQELTTVPFRCVDEINQGMDSTNERKVFELVVKTACRENNSQYFLLTPKLLPDLQFSDKMTILLIHNGRNILGHSTKWVIKKFLKRRSKLAM